MPFVAIELRTANGFRVTGSLTDTGGKPLDPDQDRPTPNLAKGSKSTWMHRISRTGSSCARSRLRRWPGAGLRMPRNRGQSFPEKILCILCIDVHQKSKNREPFAKYRRQASYGSGEGTGNSRSRSALCLNGHKRHNYGTGQDWSLFFVPFVLFVVEPFLPFAGQRKLSRKNPREKSLAGQVHSLLFHGEDRSRILQKALCLFVSIRGSSFSFVDIFRAFGDLAVPSRLTSTPWWPFAVFRVTSWITLFCRCFRQAAPPPREPLDPPPPNAIASLQLQAG